MKHVVGDGKMVWQLDVPGYDNGVWMFQPDAADYALGRATIEEIIRRNKSKNLG